MLAALSEAERALSRYNLGLIALDRQDKALAAARRSHELARVRYRAGDIALIELLDAQRVLRDAEMSYARQHLNAETDLVALYKALGGGWQKQQEESPRE